MSLHKFVTDIQAQEFFDPDAGAILPVIYSQDCTREREGREDLLLATKFSYFHACLRADVESDDEDFKGSIYEWMDKRSVLVVKEKDMRFAIDGTCFKPRTGDRITLLKTCLGYIGDLVVEVVDFARYTDSLDESNPFVLIAVKTYLTDEIRKALKRVYAR